MRNQTIDIAKGIGILTVVLCHNWILYHDRGELSRVVFSFHMPLFFFISGIFFKDTQSFNDVLKTKTSALLKPFYVVLIGLFLFDLVTLSDFDIKQGFLRLLYGSGTTVPWVPLWFLSHLFIVFIFAWVINRFILRPIENLYLKLLFLLFILLFSTQFIDVFFNNPIASYDLSRETFGGKVRGLPFNLDIVFVSSTFFLSGFLLSKYILNFKFNYIVFIVVLFLFSFLHYCFDETIELNFRQYGNFIICTLQIFAGIYLVLGLSYLCQFNQMLNKSLRCLGEASLFILIFHYSFQHKATGILQYYFPEHQFLMALISLIASILFSLVIWKLTTKSKWLSLLFLPKRRIAK